MGIVKDFFGCNKNRKSDYGIDMEWISDGLCDCSDCSDENE